MVNYNVEDNENSNIPDFLLEMLQNQYGIELTKKIINGYEKNRIVSLRVNTIKSDANKVKNELTKAGIKFENVHWSSNAIIIKDANERQIEALDIYKNGDIYLQSLSSMLPAQILNPKENADILDMAAAPGGKTTQMAALSNNKAHITACEINKIRAERLKYNIVKQGANCVYVMLKDARNIDDFFSFDQILLDAPCSGSGTLNLKDQNLIKFFNLKLIQKSKTTQETLLKKAIKILKPGQEMVYSTCSILECENEDVVNKVIRSKKVEIVPIEFDGKENLPLLPVKIKGTICVCPNEMYEGFFIAKIKKI